MLGHWSDTQPLPHELHKILHHGKDITPLMGYNFALNMQLHLRRVSRLLVAAMLTAVVLSPANPVFAGDAFVKGGVILHPRDIGFEGRWRAAFGSDYAANFAETLFIGFELQTSVYRQDLAEGGPTATILPANGFVNVKYKSTGLRTRPFGGGGLGLISRFQFASGDTTWDRNFGFHLLGGVELGHLVLELQLQKGFDSEIATEWAAYAGFVF